MDGKHLYSNSTKLKDENKQVLARICAHTVDILTEGGQVITTHRHAFGENRTDISDYSATLDVLMKNSGARGSSRLRRETRHGRCTAIDGWGYTRQYKMQKQRRFILPIYNH